MKHNSCLDNQALQTNTLHHMRKNSVVDQY